MFGKTYKHQAILCNKYNISVLQHNTPEQPVFTEEDIHSLSILKETPENQRSESSTETITFDPLTNTTESRTKNPEMSNLIATASNQPLSANAR